MSNTWNAFTTLDRLLDDVMNDVMGSTFGTATNPRRFSPDVDVRINDAALVFAVDVPGLTQEELDVSVDNGVLTIKGERKHSFQNGERVVLGRSYGAFSRSYNLPEYVDVDRLSAELKDGVLTIEIPKLQRAKPRRIAIKLQGAKDHERLPSKEDGG